ncbi:putative sexual development protein [Aspergillus heteromorphus CBS 117.55]|uniref:Putative sexual development protein n=1 Tax=Aspergillus heteromorphus CBS 117.55 TaxID=1448321 RepID=A0A317W295_9EURO|nr:putative sexual development protein [Aspergillus heteromorphus CBS 117.55]PWY79308.1 putative sexual development protein [Aspergillus heteromorphus CBS 117.55]
MPNPDDSQLQQISLNAHGTPPNSPLPATISQNGITNLQLIAFNELFEVAFFNQLLLNITTNVEGYFIANDADRDFTIQVLTAILAQEEVHALTANTGLKHFNQVPIEPCNYTFPVSTFDEAIALAATFTDVVLGTLQDVIVRFAAANDVDLTRIIAATIGNEGEQQGWFRLLQDKIPSESPTLTTSDVNFAFTAIQSFVIPGTCPNIELINLKTFPALNIVTPPEAKTQEILVSFSVSKEEAQSLADGKLWLTYVNQLNVPITEPLGLFEVDKEEGVVVAKALFPYDDNLLNGLTIAAVTGSEGPFADVNAVAEATLFGPGLIIVN